MNGGVTLQRSEDSTVYTNDAYEARDADERRLSVAKQEESSDTPHPVEEDENSPSSLRSLYRSATDQDGVHASLQAPWTVCQAAWTIK